MENRVLSPEPHCSMLPSRPRYMITLVAVLIVHITTQVRPFQWDIPAENSLDKLILVHEAML